MDSCFDILHVYKISIKKIRFVVYLVDIFYGGFQIILFPSFLSRSAVFVPTVALLWLVKRLLLSDIPIYTRIWSISLDINVSIIFFTQKIFIEQKILRIAKS